jgi:hypothetical protein
VPTNWHENCDRLQLDIGEEAVTLKWEANVQRQHGDVTPENEMYIASVMGPAKATRRERVCASQ